VFEAFVVCGFCPSFIHVFSAIMTYATSESRLFINRLLVVVIFGEFDFANLYLYTFIYIYTLNKVTVYSNWSFAKIYFKNGKITVLRILSCDSV